MGVVEGKKHFLQLNGITFQAQCQQHILTDILHSYFHIAIQCILDVSASFNNIVIASASRMSKLLHVHVQCSRVDFYALCWLRATSNELRL